MQQAVTQQQVRQSILIQESMQQLISGQTIDKQQVAA